MKFNRPVGYPPELWEFMDPLIDAIDGKDMRPRSRGAIALCRRLNPTASEKELLDIADAHWSESAAPKPERRTFRLWPHRTRGIAGSEDPRFQDARKKLVDQYNELMAANPLDDEATDRACLFVYTVAGDGHEDENWEETLILGLKLGIPFAIIEEIVHTHLPNLKLALE